MWRVGRDGALHRFAKPDDRKAKPVRIRHSPPNVEGTAARAATGLETQGIADEASGFESSTFRHAVRCTRPMEAH